MDGKDPVFVVRECVTCGEETTQKLVNGRRVCVKCMTQQPKEANDGCC